MSPSLTRREQLSGCIGIILSLAGCTQQESPEQVPSTSTPTKTTATEFSPPPVESDAEVRTERVSSISEEATVVHFSELSNGEAALMRTVVADGSNTWEMADEDAPIEEVNAFIDRLGPRPNFLEFQGEYYALWIRIEDQVMADSASSN
jgi:hypothetical protein